MPFMLCVESFLIFTVSLIKAPHNISQTLVFAKCHKETQWQLLEKNIGQLSSDNSNSYLFS